MAVSLLMFVLAACGGGGTPPGGGDTPPGNDGPDSFFEGREAYGGPVPEGAQLVSQDEFKRLAEEEGFVWDSLIRQQRLRDEAEARFRADEEEINRLIAADPSLGWLLDEPSPDDPDVEALPTGEYLVTMTDNNGEPLVVRTMGKRETFRDFLVARERYMNRDNQLELYTFAFEALPAFLKTGLMEPAKLTGASAEEIMTLLQDIEARLTENSEPLEALARELQASIVGDSDMLSLLQAQDDFRPPGYPSSAAAEMGAGLGSDRTGNGCSPDGIGLYENFWWPLKYYQTSVKNQGKRGSCVAFTLTSALETLVAVRQNKWVNLSEQHLYHQIKTQWEPANYGDGASTTASAETFGKGTYLLPFEEQWDYNPSYSRIDVGSYFLSCNNYDGFCSDTAHQARFVCVSNGAYCGYSSPANPQKSGYKMSKATVLWSGSGSVPYLTTWLQLLAGTPVVASIEVDVAFAENHKGYVSHLPSKNVKGGHAVHIVGFIPASFIMNHPTLGKNIGIKGRAQDSGGGFFVVKNSWGTCAGDGGYWYVPVSWANKRFYSITVFDRGPAPNFHETAPSLAITAPKDGATVNYGGLGGVDLSASVSDLQDGPACCKVTWTSDKDGVLGSGKTVSYLFGSPGERVITATAEDSKGNKTARSIALEVVNAPPVATIIKPTAGQELLLGIPYSLEGKASDPNEISGLPCSSLSWTSSRPGDPALVGCTPTATFNTLGPRSLILSATDAHGATATVAVSITVVEPSPSGPPIVTITSPTDNQTFMPNQNASLAGSGWNPDSQANVPYSAAAYRWSVKYGGQETTVEVRGGRLGTLYFIPKDYLPSSCGVTSGELWLYVTDEEGETGSDHITIGVVYGPC